MGGMDTDDLRCVDIVTAGDDSRLNVWATVLENSGAQVATYTLEPSTLDWKPETPKYENYRALLVTPKP